jgi:TolA-binding protein
VEYLGSEPYEGDGGQPAVAADGVRAAAVGLLNLTGLGLGYALLRRWLALAVCLAATAVLAFVALPARPKGVSGRAVTVYAVFLVLAGAHGAWRALRRPLAWPPKSPLALVLGLVLLAVPAASVALYKGAQDEATQKMLLDRLHTADRLVQSDKAKPFDAAKPDYASALATYRDLYDHHAGSRAARRVPASLNTYYTTVGAAYDQKRYCDAIDPLTYLRTVPAAFGGKKALGPLAGWPDDRLATSLYECGAQALSPGAASDTADADFRELLTTFPTSAQAAKVEPAYRAAIDKAAKGLGGSDPCKATEAVRALGGSAASMPGKQAGAADALAKDADRARADVQSGTYTCGVHQYTAGDFGAASGTMDSFVSEYPHDSRVALAKNVSIAAQVAAHDPAAGKHLPTLASGGSIPVTFTNDSPDPVRVLYTGPVTGSLTLRGCSGCSVYANETDAGAHACKSGGKNYAKKTLHLPAGTTYFLNEPTGLDSTTPVSHTSDLRSDYVYTECAYTVKSAVGGL